MLRAVANDGPDEPDEDPLLRDIGEFLANAPLRLIDWLLLVVALGILARQLTLLYLRTRPGRVEVGAIVDRTAPASEVGSGPNPQPPPDDHAVTMQMKSTLSDLNLGHAPTVPAGAVRGAPIAVIEEPTLARARVVIELAMATVDWFRPKTGYRITGLVETRASGRHSVTVEVTSRYDGQVVQTHAVEEDDRLVAAQAVARLVYKTITSRDENLRGTPLWSNWASKSDRPLIHYAQAVSCERDEKWGDAASEYGEAVAEEPTNAIVALRQGNAQERAKQHTEALRTYLRVVALWPQLIEARYRLGITYASLIETSAGRAASPVDAGGHADLAAAEEELAAGEIKWLGDVMPLVVRTAAGPGEAPLTVESFPKTRSALNSWLAARSERQWEILREQLSLRRLVVAWIGAASPSAWRPGWRRYLGQFVRPLAGVRRREFRMAIEMASRATSVNLADRTWGPNGEGRDRWLRATERSDLDWVERQIHPSRSRRAMRLFYDMGIDWRVRYNAACFYAALHGLVEYRARDKGHTAEDAHAAAARYGSAAVDQLYEVLQRPGSEEMWTWMGDDPDLAALRPSAPAGGASSAGHDDFTALADALPSPKGDSA